MSSIESRVFGDFQRDLIRYRDETGKTTNEVLATRALDFSIKATKLYAAEAPTKEEIDQVAKDNDYRVVVRKRILKKLGATEHRRGKSRSKAGNKSARAVQMELATRRSSVKWLSKSIPKWRASLNKGIPETSRDFGKSYTRGKKKIVGQSRGDFTKKVDRVWVNSQALAIDDVDSRKRIFPKALEESRVGFVSYLDRRIGKDYAKKIKRVYR